MYCAKAQGGDQAVSYWKEPVHEGRGSATTREDGGAVTVAEQNLR